MIGRDMLSKMYAHSAWALAKILSGAGQLSDAQWNAANDFTGRSLHEILFHSMGSEIAWFTAASTGARPATRLAIADFPTVDSLRVRWDQQQAAVQRYLSGVSDETLAQTAEVRNPDGSSFSMTRWYMLLTAALHNVQHRAESAAILSGLGQSPGDLDFIYFVRDL